MMIRGAIDRIDSSGIVGWLYSPDLNRVRVQAFNRYEIVGEANVDIYRQDLEAVGFGDGRCGFEIRFEKNIESGHLALITVRPMDIDLTLPTLGALGYLDLIGAVMSEKPGSGRNRSVLGGLWTDRSDASQILAGRVAVGVCAAELRPLIQEIVLNGYVVLDNVLAPSGMMTSNELRLLKLIDEKSDAGLNSDLQAALTAIASLLFRDSVVRVLRAMFDDHPIIYQLRLIEDSTEFAQASTFETTASPGECAAIYCGNTGGAVTIQIVRDSHELSEFSPQGRSRWVEGGAAELRSFATAAGLSIDTVTLDAQDVMVASPGLVHRVVPFSVPVLRAVVAPRRLTPLRFLAGNGNWIEVIHPTGARIRV